MRREEAREGRAAFRFRVGRKGKFTLPSGLLYGLPGVHQPGEPGQGFWGGCHAIDDRSIIVYRSTKMPTRPSRTKGVCRQRLSAVGLLRFSNAMGRNRETPCDL